MVKRFGEVSIHDTNRNRFSSKFICNMFLYFGISWCRNGCSQHANPNINQMKSWNNPLVCCSSASPNGTVTVVALVLRLRRTEGQRRENEVFSTQDLGSREEEQRMYLVEGLVISTKKHNLLDYSWLITKIHHFSYMLPLPLVSTSLF